MSHDYGSIEQLGEVIVNVYTDDLGAPDGRGTEIVLDIFGPGSDGRLSENAQAWLSADETRALIALLTSAVADI
jgi:hypothetical protein